MDDPKSWGKTTPTEKLSSSGYFSMVSATQQALSWGSNTAGTRVGSCRFGGNDAFSNDSDSRFTIPEITFLLSFVCTALNSESLSGLNIASNRWLSIHTEGFQKGLIFYSVLIQKKFNLKGK